MNRVTRIVSPYVATAALETCLGITMKIRPAALIGAMLLPVIVLNAEPAGDAQQKEKPALSPERKEEMKRRIEELRKNRDEWFSKHPGEKMEGHSKPMNDEMREKLSGFRARIEELHKEGKHQEADALRDKLAGQLMEERKRHQLKGGDESPVDRLNHLNEAIKHLHAAGMHDVASNLEKAAAQMKEQLKEPKHQGEGKDEIHALREQVEKLQHAVEELRGQLHKAAPQEDVRKPANP